MQVQINHDKNIEGSERLENYITLEIQNSLTRFEDKITRLEIHLADENSGKSSEKDKRCIIEARIEKVAPIAVTEHADTIEKAFHGALAKIKKLLATRFDKIRSY